MPTILMLRDAFGAGGTLLAKGSRQSVNTALATQLIGQGAASPLADWYPPGAARAQPSRSRRIKSAGRRVYAFDSHAALTIGGQTAGWTVSTVDGHTGMTHDSRGAFTRQKSLVKLVCNGSQLDSTGLVIETPSNLNTLAASTLIALIVHVDPGGTWSAPGVGFGFSPTNAFDWLTDYNVGFNSNQLRPGRNYLLFNTAASSHPFGISKNVGSFNPVAAPINKAQLQFQVPTGQTATIYLEAIWAGVEVKPVVMLGFDDTGGTHIDQHWMRLLSRYGIKGYCAWSNNGAADSSYVNDYDGDASGQPGFVARMKRWHDVGGHDVINHTLNHTNTSSGGAQVLTDGQLLMAVKGGYDLQMRHGLWRGADIYAASQGQWSVSANSKIAGMGFRAQRNGAQKPNITETPWGLDQPDNLGWYSLDSPVGGGTAAFSLWKAAIDKNIAYQSTTWCGAHAIVPGGTADGEAATGNSLTVYDTTMERFLRYLVELREENEIEIMAPSAWADDVLLEPSSAILL